MNWQKFENLQYIANTKDSSDTAVILFHGYGADATDLYTLSQVYKLSEECDWFFPQGVLEVPIGPMMTGRAWFEIPQEEFENMHNRKVKDNGIAPRSEQTLVEVTRWLNKMGSLYKKVFIGGFSQGAIMTSHSLYRLEFQPAGLLLLSGFLVAPSSFPTIPENLKVPFFQSHGTQDMVLPVDGARQLFDHLEKLGLNGKWYEFGGAHEIPMDVIAESQMFLNSVLDQKA